MLMNRKEIEGILPHRDPFLLVDEITELEPGIRAAGNKIVTSREFWIPGHFPQQPIMPGVLVLEAIAQVGAIIALSLKENVGRLPIFGAMNHVKFKGKVVPGDVLHLSCEIIKVKGPVGIGKGIATVNDKEVAEGEFTYMLQ